jgi:hypothetical protein
VKPEFKTSGTVQTKSGTTIIGSFVLDRLPWEFELYVFFGRRITNALVINMDFHNVLRQGHPSRMKKLAVTAEGHCHRSTTQTRPVLRNRRYMQTAHAAAQLLNNQGWETPSFPALLGGPPSPATSPSNTSPPPPNEAGNDQLQRQPTQPCARSCTRAYASLDPASQAMMASQSGPFASRVFTTIPHTPELASSGSSCSVPSASQCLVQNGDRVE